VSPDQQEVKPLKLNDILGNRSIVLCPGLGSDQDSKIRTGLVDSDYVSRLLVDDDDQQFGYKGFLGRTIRENRSLASIGDRVARSMGVVVDDLGKLRCPPGTPNANQFTDLQMTGCMDAPSAGQIVNGVADASDSLMNGLAGRRNKGIVERTQRVIDKYGPLDTIDQQKEALSKAFPNAQVFFKDRFLNRITPTGRRKITEARRAFAVSLLAEADEFPDVAESVGLISDRLGFVNGQSSIAMVSYEPNHAISGVHIHMSQWSVTSLGERVARRAADSTSKREGLPSISSNGINKDTSINDRMHHYASHEFGHVVDLNSQMKSWGFDPKKSNGRIDFVKTRPANDALIEAELAGALDELQKADPKSAKQAQKQFSDFFEGLMKNEWFGRKLDSAELEMLDEVLGSAYASAHFQQTDDVIEYIAELFAQIRISGYGSEIPNSSGDLVVRQPREILRDFLSRDIPGADDAAGGRQIGEIKSSIGGHEMMEEKGMRRRLARRLERFIPVNMREDGDGDGFVNNPLTGRDDVPVARGQAAIANTRAQAIYRSRKPKDTNIVRMSSIDDDDPDELFRSLGLPIGKPIKRTDRWGSISAPKPENKPSSAQEQAEQSLGIQEQKVRRATLKNINMYKLTQLSDQLLDLNEDLQKRRTVTSSSDEESDSDDVGERAFKRINKIHLRLLQILKEKRARDIESGIELDVTEDNIKRLYKGLESLRNIRDDIDDDYDILKSPLIDDLYAQIRKLYKEQFDSLPEVEKKSFSNDFEVKAIGKKLGRRGKNAVRRIFKKPDFDGDGDGFVTNPATGRDDLPFVQAPSAPDVAPKKRSLFASMVRKGKNETPLARMEWTEADPDPSSPSSWAGRFAVYKEMMMGQNVKARPWAPIAMRVAEIESLVEARFGKLETPEEIKKALKSAVPTAQVKVKLSKEKLNDPGIRAEIIGYLYMMSRLPEHFGSARKIEIHERDARPLVSSSATETVLQSKWREHGGKLINHLSRGTKLDVMFAPNQMVFRDDGTILAAQAKDTVGTQIVKSYLRHLEETNAIEEGILTEEEALRTAILLQGLSTGVHEAGHAIHHTRSSMWTGKENPQEIVEKINDILTNRPDDIKTTIFRSWFSKDILNGIQLSLMVQAGYGGDINNLAAAAQNQQDPNLKKMLSQLLDDWKNNPFTDDGLIPGYLFSEYESEEKIDLMQQIVTGGLDKTEWAKFIWGEDAQSDIAERLFDDMMKFANDAGIEQTTADEIREEMFSDQDSALSAALGILLAGRMWDDLSSKEISTLRRSWKHISSYAKDKNSSYSERYGSNRPSLEGVAEAITARIFGFSFIKDNPDAEAALDKLIAWIYSSPEPSIAIAFDKIIELFGDFDVPDDEDGTKSLYDGLAGASKDLYLLLGLKEPQ